jgi:AcrR family transcriptional regulator
MPKRIPGLSETILEQASLLFSRLGYDAVDMKQVAAEAGTSVGNLYNYYPSKPALFLAIKTRWKEDLIEACDELLDSDLPRREKILAVLRRLYDDVARWHGLWREFLSGSEERAHLIADKAKNLGARPWGLGADDKNLLSRLESLLLNAPATDPEARWAFVTVSATLQLAGRYPEQTRENWHFLETLVDKI